MDIIMAYGVSVSVGTSVSGMYLGMVPRVNGFRLFLGKPQK